MTLIIRRGRSGTIRINQQRSIDSVHAWTVQSLDIPGLYTDMDTKQIWKNRSLFFKWALILSLAVTLCGYLDTIKVCSLNQLQRHTDEG